MSHLIHLALQACQEQNYQAMAELVARYVASKLSPLTAFTEEEQVLLKELAERLEHAGGRPSSVFWPACPARRGQRDHQTGRRQMAVQASLWAGSLQEGTHAIQH